MTKTRIHYIKDEHQFLEIYDKMKYIKITTLGINSGKSIFQKIPTTEKEFANPDHPKFKYHWISKDSTSLNEIISSEPFRILLGEQFAPKYRFTIKDAKLYRTMSKLLDHFTPWCQVPKVDIEVNSEEAKQLGYMGSQLDKHKPYNKYALAYLKAVSEIENFNRMLAVSLLFGKDDLHPGNWGIVEIDGRKYAATIDHEHAFQYIGLKYVLRSGHRKEQLLSKNFVLTCRSIVDEFEQKKEMLREKISDCIAEINKHNVKIDNIPVVDYLIAILETNKCALYNLAFQIEAEIAIKQGNHEDLHTALLALPENYFPDPGKPIPSQVIISMQNHYDGSINTEFNSFDRFIILRKWNTIIDDSKIIRVSHSENGTINVKFKKSSTIPFEKTESDIKIEKELLSVYDEIYQSKRHKNRYER